MVCSECLFLETDNMKTRTIQNIQRDIEDAKRRLKELQSHGDSIVINGYQPVTTEKVIKAVSNYLAYWQNELDEAVKNGEQLAFNF